MTAASAVAATKRRRECHRGAAAWNEPAHHDELRAVAVERPLRPRAGLHALRRGKEPALHRGAEPAAEQVAQVVADEGARGGAADKQRDARVGAPRGRDAERDDRALTGQRGEDRVERRDEERDQVRKR
jgi:hypothetical protein